MNPVTVVIPVERGREWNRDRATAFKDGTPYLIAEHDPGEYAKAVNDAVDYAGTEFVIVSGPDFWWERQPEAVEFLPDLAWNCDVTYGPMHHIRDGHLVGMQGEGLFCANRLTRENYIPPAACFRRDTLRAAGGMMSGPWELYNRLVDHGARFKHVGEALSANDGDWKDPSPKPQPKELLATFYQQATPGTAYWRCALPARFLPGQVIFNMPGMKPGDGRAEYNLSFGALMADPGLTFPNHAGTAVFQFAGDEVHHDTIAKMKQQGIRVLVEVDDDYAHWDRTVMPRAGWAEKIGDKGTGYTVEQHRKTVALADGVIVTTAHLGKMYRDVTDNVYVCPNQIDPADWPEPEKPQDGKLRIGWFGSRSHEFDGKLIRRALEWAAGQPHVEIVMIGVGAGKAWFKFPYKHCLWSNDLSVYKMFLRELDIGLCPVVSTPWAQNRSDLKALEYGMAQAFPIVSDCPPYETVDLPKAKTPKDWLNQLKKLVDDPDGTRQKAKEWRDYVLENRTVEKNVDCWRLAVAG